jgi:hypothetical protein
MRPLVNILLVAILVGLVGQYLGWIAVPVVAAIVSIGSRELNLKPWHAGAGAALAWGVMLIPTVLNSSFNALLASLGRIFQLPGPALVCVTLLLPFLLAWSSSTIASDVLARRR